MGRAQFNPLRYDYFFCFQELLFPLMDTLERRMPLISERIPVKKSHLVLKCGVLPHSHTKPMPALLQECGYDELGWGNKSCLTDEFTSSQEHLTASLLYRLNKQSKKCLFGVVFICVNIIK